MIYKLHSKAKNSITKNHSKLKHLVQLKLIT